MKLNYLLIAGILIFMILPVINAQEEEIRVFGADLEEVIGVIVAIISLILFIITFIAYRRDGRIRFLFVSIAFLLFFIKSFFDSSELFIEEIEILGPLAVILELFVILFFFFGIIKKRG